MLSVSETSGFGVDLSGVTYTADPSLPISGTGEAQTIRLDQAGTYTFTAHYSGDNEKYLAADSNRVTVTVTKKADVSGGTTSGGGSSSGGGSTAGGGSSAGADLQQGADPRQEAVQQQEVPPREAAQLTEMHLQQLRRTSRIRMERLLP